MPRSATHFERQALVPPRVKLAGDASFVVELPGLAIEAFHRIESITAVTAYPWVLARHSI